MLQAEERRIAGEAREHHQEGFPVHFRLQEKLCHALPLGATGRLELDQSISTISSLRQAIKE